MGHAMTAILLIGISQQILRTYADVGVPFIHNFNASLHGWRLGNEVWHWTGHFNQFSKTHNPFHSESNYVWTHMDAHVHSYDDPHGGFYYQFVTSVTRHTQFHFKYWFYTEGATGGYFKIYLIDTKDLPLKYKPLKVICNDTNHWHDVTIDCQVYHCCETYNCDLKILIHGSDGAGLIAIQSVSATLTGGDKHVDRKLTHSEGSKGHNGQSEPRKSPASEAEPPMTATDGWNFFGTSRQIIFLVMAVVVIISSVITIVSQCKPCRSKQHK